jgi:hypothetical protein
MLIRARRLARSAGRQIVSQQDIEQTASEFSPARDEMAIEYQTLVAVREATSRQMVPEKYRHLSPAELSQRIEALRAYIR